MFSHIELNVIDLAESTRFYLLALRPLGFNKAEENGDAYTRLSNGVDTVIVLCPVEREFEVNRYHRKAVGLGHFAIAVQNRADVDSMERHLADLGIPLLGQGKIEIGYRRGYYTLSFEDPQRIMIEIVYHDSHYFSLASP